LSNFKIDTELPDKSRDTFPGQTARLISDETRKAFRFEEKTFLIYRTSTAKIAVD